MPDKLSAVVVSYNRVEIIGTCLRGVAFADEVIVVDKSSTDGTAEIAARHADRLMTVPWTPTVEDTRAFAVAQCSGDWILCLDDDECLSPGSGEAIRHELAAPRADIYELPLRHYILGRHDDGAYYWPEHHPRLFRRGALAFSGTVHGGIERCSERVLRLAADGAICIHHLSHRDVADWIAKCNRYTSRLDRRRAEHDGNDLAGFAHTCIDAWQARGKDAAPDGYPAAVGLLRAVYDIVDRLKTWEEERGLDGAAAFARICAGLDAGYAAGADRRAAPGEAVPDAPAAPNAAAVLGVRIADLRQRCEIHAAEASRWAAEAARLQAALADALAQAADAHDALGRACDTLAQTRDALGHERARIAAIETSTTWRATAGARRIAEHAKRLARR